MSKLMLVFLSIVNRGDEYTEQVRLNAVSATKSGKGSLCTEMLIATGRIA